jgi:hypothetical protein
MDNSITAILRQNFSAQELKLALKEARYVTAWVYHVIQKLAQEEALLHA